MDMHILFLTDNFPPEVNAPASRTFEHCREWARAGHRVTVMTCAPNFPSGKVFDGYRNRLWQTEVMEGVWVIRVWSYITANEGFVKRILDYQSFMVTAILAALFVRGVDVVVGTSPQFFTVCAAYAVSRLKRIPFVFELRDLWPESIKAVGAMNDSAIHPGVGEGGVVSIPQGGTDRLSDAFIQADLDRAWRRRRQDHGRDQWRGHDALQDPCPRIRSWYGHWGWKANSWQAMWAPTAWRTTWKPCWMRPSCCAPSPMMPLFHFILLGDGARKQALKDEAARRELDNVTFIDSVPKEQVARYWSLLDVSVIHLRKTDLFTTVIPSKLFECMGMGLPVLHGVAGESAEIVREERVGIVFEPENATQLVEQLRFLRRDRQAYGDYRNNCMEAAKKYDRTTMAMKMLAVMTELAPLKNRP